MSEPDCPLHLHRAARVVDGAGVDAAPGVLLRRGECVEAAGSPESIGVPADAEVVDDRSSVLLPALGNAHAHLDLSAIEPAPFDGDFAGWLARIREARRGFGEQGAERSLRHGARLALAGGTLLVGDVLGAPLHERGAGILADEGLLGVAFVEVFGAGRSEAAALAAVERVHDAASTHGAAADGMRLGIQPHAPHTSSAAVVASALRSGLPFSIHLAESEAEVEYCRHGSGPMRTLLEQVGVIERADGATAAGGSHPGVHPVEWFCSTAREAHAGGGDSTRPLVVHLEQVEAKHASTLALARAIAVFCPRASASFGRSGMPWRALRAAGVPVALGTDGRMTLDTPERVSTLDELRFLWRRDRAALDETLPMATIEVARALGFPEQWFTLSAGWKPGLLAVEARGDPRDGLLRGDEAPRWIFRRGAP